ncbi:MAG: hypothetical protein EA428_00945 [Spirochaetaceae bacterium]|nr:MAG: hypothetical protein EA428_00945 [Spirochaetaceae bacterium]
MSLAPQLAALGYSEIAGARYFGIHTVSINSRTLSLLFEADPDALYISVEGVDLPTRYRIESERDGGVLRIRVVGDDSPGASLDRARVHLKVPPHLRIIANTTYGDISVKGVSSGPLQLVSGTGSVHVMDSVGDLVLETESGELQVENVSGEAVLTAGQGEIVVKGFQGALTAHTTLGAQRYSDMRGALSISTNSGDLFLENVEAELRLTSTHGAIYADQLLLTGPSDIRSLSGDMRLLLRNPLAELLMDLQAGILGRLMLNGSEVESGLQTPVQDTEYTESTEASENAETTETTEKLADLRVYVGAGVLELYTDGGGQ